jgi:hypothetical protein
MLRAKPAKGAPNVVGTPSIVGIPLWVVAHVAVLGDVERGADGLESGLVPRRVSELVTGADGFGLSANGWRADAAASQFGRAERNSSRADG